MAKIGGKWDEQMDEEVKSLESVLDEFPISLHIGLLNDWEGLYARIEMPDEMSQSFPSEGQLTEHVEFIKKYESFLTQFPSKISLAMIAQFSRIRIDYSLLENSSQNSELFINFYKENEELFTTILQTEETLAFAANIFGWEYRNFGLNKKKQLDNPNILFPLKDSRLIPQILKDIAEFTFVESWKYSRDIFEVNTNLYKRMIIALESSSYSDKEKIIFLKTKPLIPNEDSGLLKENIFSFRLNNYSSINLKQYTDYNSALELNIISASHKTLEEAQKDAYKQIIDTIHATSLSEAEKLKKKSYANLGFS